MAVNTLSLQPQASEKKIKASFRLADDPAITVVTAATQEGKAVPVLWSSFAAQPDAGCAWLVVVDTSNPARQKTVAACAEEVRKFLGTLPAEDAVMLATLARDLTVISGFEAEAAARLAAVDGVKIEGESALATLIYHNLRTAVEEHLAKRKEPRKAVILFTDGKDETPGGPEALRARRDELIALAKKAGVAIHTLGYAEKASEANWFADLKEVSQKTDAMHVAAETAAKKLPENLWKDLAGIMHGGGTALVDVASLEAAQPLRLEARTASAKKAEILISQEQVSAALISPPPAPPEAGTGKGKDPAGDDKKSKAKPEEAKPEEAEPAEVAETAAPAWIWWAAGGAVALLTVILMIASSRRRAAAEAAQVEALRAEQARVLDDMLRAPEPLAPATAFAWLEMCDDKKTRYAVSLTSVKIGRGQQNDIVFRNDSVSGNHCLVFRDKQGAWTIKDLSSGNGVIVNELKVAEQVLKTGDVIELGDLKMRFLLNL